MKVAEAGSGPIAWIENEALILETKKQLWQSIHTACKAVTKDADLAQELIEERRIAATAENQ